MSHPWLWAIFAVMVVGILVFDLGVMGRRKRAISTRRALIMVGVYTSLALLFGGAIFVTVGPDPGLEYVTAWLLEQSLSLDNIFIWVLIFEHFRIEDAAQKRVLFWGIIGAMVLRGIFIFAGTALIGAFEWLLYLFGALVIVSGIRLLVNGGESGRNIGDSRLLRLLRRRLKVVEDSRDRSFFVRREGKLHVTQMFLALVVIEVTDLIFALDSIPAIFGISRDPLIVYTSNIFAVLGLRALYFAVSGLVEHLRYLRFGLALLLVLIGAKMIGGHFVDIPIWMTLSGTVAILGGTVAISLWVRHRDTKARSSAAG